MAINERLVRHVLNRTQDAGEITKLLQFYESVERQRRGLHAEREKARSQYEFALKQIDNAELVNRQRCDHPDTEYHGDPSGGLDSHTTCVICGAEL